MKTMSDKEIIKNIFILFAVFIGMILLVYLPRRSHYRNIQQELAEVKRDTLRIEETVAVDGSLEDGLLRLNQIDKDFATMFPAKEEDGLSQLEQKAKNLSVEILSTQARPKAPVEIAVGEPLLINGKPCQKVLLSIDMRAQYNDLIRFLTALKEPGSPFVTIERITMDKQGEEKDPLHIVIELQFYLIG